MKIRTMTESDINSIVNDMVNVLTVITYENDGDLYETQRFKISLEEANIIMPFLKKWNYNEYDRSFLEVVKLEGNDPESTCEDFISNLSDLISKLDHSFLEEIISDNEIYFSNPKTYFEETFNHFCIETISDLEYIIDYIRENDFVEEEMFLLCETALDSLMLYFVPQYTDWQHRAIDSYHYVTTDIKEVVVKL